MKAYIDNNWGLQTIIFKNGDEEQVNGQYAKYNGITGRIWPVEDSSSYCAGHGLGNVYGSKTILVDKELQIHKIENKSRLDNIFDIEILTGE